MISSGWACAGAKSAQSPIVRRSALTDGSLGLAPRRLELLQICACVGDLRSAFICAIGNRENLLVIRSGLGLVSRLFGRCRCACEGAQPGRLLLQCRVEGAERFLCIAAVK